MNIFVGFGYNDNDNWVKELVFPLIESFGGTVVTGEDLHGQIISEAVKDRIKQSDGVFALQTRRDPLAVGGYYTTHVWVINELTTAINNGILAVEVRELKVDPQFGINGDRQHLTFDLDNKAQLIVNLAKILCDWRRKLKPRRFILLPKEVVQDARPFINDANLKCSYQYLDGSRETVVYYAKPIKVGQGLCVDILNAPSDEALVQLTVTGPSFKWSSGYESVQLLSINLEKDQI